MFSILSIEKALFKVNATQKHEQDYKLDDFEIFLKLKHNKNHRYYLTQANDNDKRVRGVKISKFIFNSSIQLKTQGNYLIKSYFKKNNTFFNNSISNK